MISGLIGRTFVGAGNVTNQRVSALQRLGFRLIYSPVANRVAGVLSTIGSARPIVVEHFDPF